MTRIELSGYVQIVIGIVGIVLTLLTAPSILDAIDALGAGQALPREFAGIGGAIRIFSVVFVLVALVFLVSLGLSITLSTLASGLGAYHPMLCAGMAVGALICFSISITLAALGTPIWVPSLACAVALTILSVVAAADSHLPHFWVTGSIFVGILFLIGLATIPAVVGFR